MSEQIAWVAALVGLPATCVLAILLLARLWRSQERRILAVACFAASGLVVAEIVFAIAVGGNNASLTVRNETPWPVEVSGVNIDPHTVPAHDSKEFRSYGGPGWIDGLIDEVEIVGGPARSKSVFFDGLEAGKSFEITVTEGLLAAGEYEGP